MRLSILYIGTRFGTSGHRAAALERLGHHVTIVDPEEFIGPARLTRKWLWETGGFLFEKHVTRNVLSRVPAYAFDLALVNGGELVGPELVSELKRRCSSVINYNNDDPFGGRDGRRWRLYRQSLPVYDLAVVTRDCNVPEAYAAGARSVRRVLMSADEVAHKRRSISKEEQRSWSSEVVFVGTWMPERGKFLADLMELGVPLSIYGDRWTKAPEWHRLRPIWRGPGMFGAYEYACAIQSAKVCLGLLSKGNRDQSTTRSFEIPLLGGVLCAERTPEHEDLYRENRHAMFWSTAEECAVKCRLLLEDEDLRRRIGIAARDRCFANGTINEVIMSGILDTVFLKGHLLAKSLENAAECAQ